MKPAEGATVIGQSIVIHGELSGSEDLFLDGTIDGTLRFPGNRLTVGPNARVLAEIHAQEIIIFGHVTGNVYASGRVDLRQSASLIGDISASRLSIEENATIRGRADLTGAAAPSSSNSADVQTHTTPSTASLA